MTQTIHDLLQKATHQLSGVTDVAALEADLLLAHVLEKPRSYVFARKNEMIGDEVQTLFSAMVNQRADGKPLAYLTGHKEFWSLTLKVTEAVLIPRPETETLVDSVLNEWGQEHIRLADLGTGSGAIALAIAHERPHWDIIATDQSSAALMIAQENARRLNVSNITFLSGSWYEPLMSQRFHLIVANPPYLAENDVHLTQSGLPFEPRTALVSGKEGLDAIRAIVADARRYLMPGGSLLLEHGFEQGPAVRDLLKAQGFLAVQTVLDAAGLERVTKGLTPEGFGVYSTHAGVLSFM